MIDINKTFSVFKSDVRLMIMRVRGVGLRFDLSVTPRPSTARHKTDRRGVMAIDESAILTAGLK